MGKEGFVFSYDKPLRKMRVASSSPQLLGALIDVFTVNNPSYFFMKSKGAFVDEFLMAVSPLGTFAPGLFPSVYRAALSLVDGDKSRIEVSAEDKATIIQKVTPYRGIFSDGYEIENLSEERPLRWYQRAAVWEMLKRGSGICVAATSAGKSLCIATLVNEIRKNGFPLMGEKRNILLIVPTRQLVDQMYGDLSEYGLKDICKFTSDSGRKRDGTYSDNSCSNGFANLIITNHAWITDKAKQPLFKENAKVGCIIADEVHTVSPKTQILKLVEKLDVPVKFGFTGTLPDFIYDKWVNFGMFGTMVYEIDPKTLQNEGFITNLEVHPIHCEVEELKHQKMCPFALKRSVKLGDVLEDGTELDVGTAYSMEVKYIEENASKLFSPVFDAMTRNFDFAHRNMIVLFDRTNIGHGLEQMLREKFAGVSKIHYMDGTTEIAIREKKRGELEKTNGNILLAQTATASTGLNIRNLHGIAFAFSGKSYVRIIQSIGRVLRLHENKDVAKLFEIWYNMRYSTSHHFDKMSILRDTYGDSVVKAVTTVKV